MASIIKYLQSINFNNHKRKYILYFVYVWSMLMLEMTLMMVIMMMLFPWSRRLPRRWFFPGSCMLAAQNSVIYSCKKMSHREFHSVKQVPLFYPYFMRTNPQPLSIILVAQPSPLLGILQNMVNPSLAPTQPDGSEFPTFSYGGEGIPRVLKHYRFSPQGYIFPIRWSNQLNQLSRLFKPVAYKETTCVPDLSIDLVA